MTLAVMKDPNPTVAAQGPIMANPPRGLEPVEFTAIPSPPWTSSSRATFPTNGPDYYEFEMDVISESDQSLWQSYVTEHYAKFRSRKENLGTAELASIRAKLVAWPAIYKSWAGI